MSDEWNVPLDEIPDDWIAPDGSIQTCQVESLEKAISNASQKAMSVLVWSVVDGEYAGLQGTEYFVFGTDDDKLALDPAGAWRNSSGARAFKKFVNACGFTGAFDARAAQEIIGQPFDALMGVEPATGQYSAKNRLKGFYPARSNGASTDVVQEAYVAPPPAVQRQAPPRMQTPASQRQAPAQQRPAGPTSQRTMAQVPPLQRPQAQRPAPRMQAQAEATDEEGTDAEIPQHPAASTTTPARGSAARRPGPSVLPAV